MAVHIDEPRTKSVVHPFSKSLCIDPERPNPDAIHSTEFGAAWIAPTTLFLKKTLHENGHESPLFDREETTVRLTVRTLLAWMDGLLGPEDQAALGEKVEASSVAPALVERVREVIARQTLSAPPPLGRGMADDPNTAAEFLDNALAADRLERFERVCVESDIHLADVAACHQLLAQLAREPAAIEPVAAAHRRRLLDTARRRLDPIAAVETGGSGRGSTRGGTAKPTSPAASESPPSRALSAVDVPEAEAAASPGLDQRVPSGDALAIVAAPAAAESAMAASSNPAAVSAATLAGVAAGQGGNSVATVRDGGPLLHRGDVAGAAVWLLLPVDAPLADREDLVAPPWCHPLFSLGGVTIRLEPGSRAVVTRDADGMPCLEVVFGRAVVMGEAADAKIGVLAGGLHGIIAGVMRQPAGIEVVFDRAPGNASMPARRAALYAGATEKVWQRLADGNAPPLAGLPPEVLLAPRAALAWDDRDPAAATLVPPSVEPAWMRFPTGGDRIERSAARALAEALSASPTTAVDEPLRRLAADRRTENRMIAAATLALLGDYRELVTLLAAERPLSLNETQWTALERMAVPLAIARGENSAAALAEAFRAAGPAGKGDTLMACARGFSDDELSAGGDALLVEALGDGSLAVRRYAIRRLLEIVQPDERHRATYRADRPDALRDDGIAWWKTQLEQGRIRRGGVPAAASAVPQDRDDE